MQPLREACEAGEDAKRLRRLIKEAITMVIEPEAEAETVPLSVRNTVTQHQLNTHPNPYPISIPIPTPFVPLT